jgi:hypothetical protein
MANRILKEGIHTSKTIADLNDWGAEVLFYRLIVACDDVGRFDGRTPVIRAKCYPLMLNDISDEDVEGWLKKLVDVGLIRFYEVDGQRYLAMLKWANHQRLRNTRPKYPAPDFDNLGELCGNPPQLAADCGLNPNPKSNPKKKSVDPALRARWDKLISLFAEAFKKATGSPYMRTFDQDTIWAKKMIALLQDSAESEVAARLDRAVERYRTDPQYSPFPTSAIAFQGRVWNRYAAPSKPSQPTRRAMTPAEVEASLRD